MCGVAFALYVNVVQVQLDVSNVMTCVAVGQV